MKLRVRNIATKETLKIQTPDPCSLQQLKLIVSDTASSSSTVHLSLNSKDEILGDVDDTLQSLGVTSGDLIFFSFNPNSFNLQTTFPRINVRSGNNPRETLIGIPRSSSSEIGRNRNENDTLVVEPESSNFETGGGEMLESVSRKQEGTLIVEPGSSGSKLDRNETLIVEPSTENKLPRDSELGRNERLDSDTEMEETLIVKTKSCDCKTGKEKTLVAEPDSESEYTRNKKSGGNETLESDSGMETETLILESDSDEKLSWHRVPELGPDESREQHGADQTMVGESVEMEIYGDDDLADAGMGKGFSVPGFLRKVFNKELGDSGGCHHKLVVIAVHAILSDSGFVGFDTVSKAKADGFYLPDVWPSSGFTLSLCYTIPEIVKSSGAVETVTLKVQSLGKYVNFYGSLAGKASGTYRVCLDRERLAIVLNLIWAKLDTAIDCGSIIHPEKEVFEFWKTVKDKLALPLLIDLCEVANLPLPSCFICLPTDVKLRILELLPGVDLARAACVSAELQFLSSYDGLWKQKYVEQFGNVEVAEGSLVENFWKRKFVKAWEANKRRRVGRMLRRRTVWIPRSYQDPSGFWFPRIVGGDYDMGPSILFGGRFFGRHGRRDFMPPCNFGDRRA